MPKNDVSENIIKIMEAESQLDRDEWNDWKKKADNEERQKEESFTDDAPPETELYQEAEVVEDKAEEKKEEPKPEQKEEKREEPKEVKKENRPPQPPPPKQEYPENDEEGASPELIEAVRQDMKEKKESKLPEPPPEEEKPDPMARIREARRKAEEDGRLDFNNK